MRRRLFTAIAASLLSVVGVSALAGPDATVTVKPVQQVMTDDGPVLVSPRGMALYTYGPDVGTPGKSQCSNVPKTAWSDTQGDFGMLPVVHPEAQKSCTQKWPSYLADGDAQPAGELSLIQRPEGGRQWAWRGKPLYYSVKDHKPGDRNGATLQGSGVGGGNARRGWALAGPTVVLVDGLRIMRLDDWLVVATSDNRPVYTPSARAGAACAGCGDPFQPVVAPALAQASGDWSTVDAGAGKKQYAFKGQPLYLPPDDIPDWEVAKSGKWQPVYFRKGPGRPPEIGTHPSLIGDVYTDKTGHSLYVFGCGTPTNDGVRCNDPGDPAGYWAALCGTADECARQWPLYRAGPDARPRGDWSIVEVADPLYTDPRGFTYPAGVARVKAWAYRGDPVHTFYHDTTPGDVRGHWIQWLGFSRFDALQVPGAGER